MATSFPRVTVVTPSLNQAPFLEQTLRSVLDQDGAGLEYLVMDGGSTDGSADIIRRYADRLAYWQSQPDGGQSAAINEGFARSTGEIMGWLNSDDRLAPGALQTVVTVFADHPECEWLAGAGEIVSEKGKVLPPVVPGSMDFDSLLEWERHPLFQPAVFWRRSLWRRAGGLDPELHFCMDLDLWLHFARLTRGVAIPDVLARAVSHPRAKTRRLAPEMFAEACLVLARHGALPQARQRLARPLRRAFELDRRLALITRNPLYRRWRDARERPPQ